MLKRVFILLLLLTLGFALFFLLDTSEQSSLSDKEQKSYRDSDTSINDNITPAIPESTTVTETPPEVIQPEPPIAESKESTSATSDTITPKRAIDLTLPEDWDAGNDALNDTLYDVPKDQVLPNLITDKKKAKDVSLNGKVLNDETKEGYLESIEGAEVSVEVKL